MADSFGKADRTLLIALASLSCISAAVGYEPYRYPVAYYGPAPYSYGYSYPYPYPHQYPIFPGYAAPMAYPQPVRYAYPAYPVPMPYSSSHLQPTFYMPATPHPRSIAIAIPQEAPAQAIPETRSVAESPSSCSCATQQLPTNWTSLDQLANLKPAELESLYRSGSGGCMPVGFFRGKVLHLSDYYMTPKLSAKLSGLAWKGKHFAEDGFFINQFTCIKALSSRAEFGGSYLDGCPTVVLEYPQKTPLFANMRDETRQIGPGLYLNWVCEKHTREFRGFIGMQLQPSHQQKSPRTSQHSDATSHR